MSPSTSATDAEESRNGQHACTSKTGDRVTIRQLIQWLEGAKTCRDAQQALLTQVWIRSAILLVKRAAIRVSIVWMC